MGYVFWTVSTLLLIALLIRGCTGGCLSAYPIFFGYVLWTILLSLVQAGFLIAYGPESSTYYYVYHFLNLSVPVWQLLLLYKVYSVIARRKVSAGSVFAALGTVFLLALPLVVWGVWSVEGSVFLRFHMVTLPMEVVGCSIVYMCALRNRQVRLGNNLRFLLLGLGIMVGLQALNFAQYIWRFESFEVFAVFVPFIYMLAVAAFLAGFWSYDPPAISATVVRQVELEAAFARSMETVLKRLRERT